MRDPNRLVVLDVDGTLIEDHGGKCTIWGLVQAAAGVPDAVREERLRLHREGRLTYVEWVALDVAGWRAAGLRRQQISVLAESLAPTTGARECLSELARRGYLLAVASASLDIVLDMHFPEVPFVARVLNRLTFDESGLVTGCVPAASGFSDKPAVIAELRHRFGMEVQHTVFVGDGENDIEALMAAGIGVAFRPKSSAVGSAADEVIESLPELLDMLP
jgi:phosphoserine phosphatase